MGTGITDVERGIEPPPPAQWWEDLPSLAAQEDERIGVKVVKRERLVERISRAMNTTAPGVAARVAADVTQSLKLPRARLEHSHWDSEEDRLLYLRYWIEYLYAWDGGKVDRDAVFAAMVQYESQRADIVVGRLPTTEEKRQVRALRATKRAEYDRREAERELREYLAMVDEIIRQERLEAQMRVMRVDIRRYPLYTHGPVAALGATWATFGPGISLILDFVPVIGQLKGIAESIIGYDMTGQKLATWERGLGLLLNLLPYARGIFRAGKSGVRMLAMAGVEAIRRGRKAEMVYRLTKVASTMTEAELQAARIAGKVASAAEVRAVENVLSHLDEMQGLSQRSWRAAAGTIDNGIPTSRSAAGMIETAAKVPGRVIAATKATKPIVAQLTKAGVSAQALAELERAGIAFSRKLVGALVKSKSAIAFVNRFHACPGFTELVKDLAVSAGRREGALFAMAYAVNKVDPALAKFELGVGITKRVRGTEVAARRVDITAGGISHELKSWGKWTLERALRKPSQLVKDTAIFGRAGTKWVFNSAKMSKKEVVELFKKAVTSDPYLKVKWPQGDALDSALDRLIEMFP